MTHVQTRSEPREIGLAIVSIADQAIVSGSSFVTGVLLGRELSAAEFGGHGLLMSALALAAGIQASLITGPFRVFGVGEHSTSYRAAQHGCQTAGTIVCSLAAAVALYALGASTALIGTYLFAMCTFLAQELVRADLLVRLRMMPLLALDLAVHGARLAALLALHGMDRLTLTSAWLMLGLSALPALLVGGYRSHRPRASDIRRIWAQNWRFGRWLLLETMASTASISVYLWVLAAVQGLEAAAGLGAALVLVNVFNVVFVGVTNPLASIARARFNQGDFQGWRRSLLRAGLLLLLLCATTSVPMIVLAGPMLAAFFGPSYEASAELVPVLCIAMCAQVCNAVFSIAFRTAERPQVGLAAKASSALLAGLICYPLVHGWGAVGAAAGMLTTQLVWLVVYFVLTLRGRFALRNQTPMTIAR